MLHRCVQFGKGCKRRQSIPAALPHHPADLHPRLAPSCLAPTHQPLAPGSRSTEAQPVVPVDQSHLSCALAESRALAAGTRVSFSRSCPPSSLAPGVGPEFSPSLHQLPAAADL